MGRNNGGEEAWEVAALFRQGWVGVGAGVEWGWIRETECLNPVTVFCNSEKLLVAK